MSHISVSTNNTGHYIDLHTLIDLNIYQLGSSWFRLELDKPKIFFELSIRVLGAKTKWTVCERTVFKNERSVKVGQPWPNRPLFAPFIFKLVFVELRRVLVVTSMLVTDVGDEMCWWQLQLHKMLVTVLVQIVDVYLFTIASGTNIPKMSPTSKFCHQYLKIVTKVKSPTSLSPF